MSKIAIISDSSHDMTFDMGKKYGLEVVPYYIQMGDKHLKDQVDIDSREFYRTMESYDTLSSGIPSVQDVIDKLDQIKEKAYTDVIMLTSSDKITGMLGLYQMIKNDYEGLNLHLYNTNQVGSSSGLVAIYAAELRDEGKSVEEIVEELDRVMKKTNIFALFRTLKYLVKGGRFNKYAGMIGTFLHINPLLKEENGEIIVVDKFRGTKKSLQGLINIVEKTIGDSKKYRLAIFSGNNEQEVLTLKEALKEIIEKAEFYIETEFTPVLGVHAGPKSVGVSVMVLD